MRRNAGAFRGFNGFTLSKKTKKRGKYHLRNCVASLLIALLISVTHLLVGLSADAQTPGDGSHQVFAHYMPNFPPRGIDPDSNYWWSAPFDPDYDNYNAKPILYTLDMNAQDRNLQAYVDEIKLAKSYGIDGFFVDLLEDNEAYRNTWQRLIQAAEIVGSFKIGLMPDSSTLGDNDSGSFGYATKVQKMKNWLDLAGNSPALLRYSGKPAVIPYAVGYPYGGTAPDEKTYVVDWFANHGMPISYMANHGLDWQMYTLPYAKDPQTGFQTFAFGTGSFSPLADVNLRQRALDYWPSSFMQMGENSFLYMNKNAHWYLSSRLSTRYRDIWTWSISRRDRFRWMQIITWNDWSESAISPSVNHFMAYQPITKYYADWFKSGSQPSITQDVISIYHRSHPAKASPSPYNSQINQGLWNASDEVEALAMLKAPATIYLNTGSKEYSISVGAGIQSLIMPFQTGKQSARIVRNGQTVAQVSSLVPIHTVPARQNGWQIGATSAFPPESVALSNWSTFSGSWSGSGASRNGSGLTSVGVGAQLGNYHVTAQVKPSSGANNTNASVVARAQGNSYYRLAVGKWDNTAQWRLSRFDNGSETVLASNSTSYQANVTRGLRLDCVGEYVVAYVDGSLKKVVSDWGVSSKHWSDTRWSYGQAGVAADGASANFTSISVKRYDVVKNVSSSG